jgi:hypothetical protein
VVEWLSTQLIDTNISSSCAFKNKLELSTKSELIELVMKQCGENAEVLRLARDIIKYKSINAHVCLKNVPLAYLMKISW